MHGPREILNEMKWRENALHEAEIWYVHRGAADDTRIVRGELVADLLRSFFVLRENGRDTSIPYHRIFLIRRNGRDVWRRHEAGGGGAPGPDA